MGIKFKKTILCLWLLFFSVCSTAAPVAMASPPVGTEAETAAGKCTDYLQQHCQAEQFDCFTGWTPIALRAVEKDFMDSRWQGEAAVAKLEQDIKTKLVSDLDITTSLARYMIILQAAGKDPADFAGQNLISRLEKKQLPSGKFPDSINNGGEELVNAHIWSMIALSATGASQWDRGKAIDWLKEQQHPDGGFNFLTGDTDADVDVTSAAIIALALSGPEADPVLARAVDYLRHAQLPGGGFASWKTENLESAAMVMQALVAAGIDPDRAPWSRGGQKLIDIIMSYQLKDGSFAHIKDGKGNLMSSEQALMALGDYIRGESVYKRLAPQTGRMTFNDLKANDPAYTAVMKLVEQGVMTGYPDKSFRPAAGISRAEFAQVLALAKGGTVQTFPGDKDFLDVSDSHWARKAIAYCTRMGWMQGIDSARFAPDQQLTGAELLTVVVKVIGLPVNERQADAAWYQPYVEAGTGKGLIYPGFKAESNATRGQCAVMMDKALK
ncbi:S-layer homology domain-containing protein [Syntrophomonas curvata]